jgi:TonB-like protein
MRIRRIPGIALIFLTLCIVGPQAQERSSTPSPTPSPTPRASPECPGPFYIGSSEPDKKLKILNKPEPRFSEEEVRKHENAVIVLQALFCGIGKVTNIRVIHGVSAGLNEEAIRAARKIKFTPAEKNGEKVSQWLQLEYYIRVDNIRP